MNILESAEKVRVKVGNIGVAESVDKRGLDTPIVNDIGFKDIKDLQFFVRFFDLQSVDNLDPKTTSMLREIYQYAKVKSSENVPAFLRRMKSELGTHSVMKNPIHHLYSHVRLLGEKERLEEDLRAVKAELR